MSELVSQVVDRLRTAGVALERGLSSGELNQVEDRFGFAFSLMHRQSSPQCFPSDADGWIGDVIYYGDNLLDYVAREFHAPPVHPSSRPHIPFWSDLADGLEADEL